MTDEAIGNRANHGGLFMNRRAFLMGYWLPPFAVLVYGLTTWTAPANLPLLFFLGPIVTFAFFVRDAWRFLDVEGKRPSPNEGFLLLVPLLWVFWQYRVLYPLGRVLQEKSRKLKLTGIEVGDSFSRVLCHLNIIAPILSPILVSIGIYVPAETSRIQAIAIITPGVILFLVWVLLGNLVLWNYSDVINAIVSEQRKQTEMESPRGMPG